MKGRKRYRSGNRGCVSIDFVPHELNKNAGETYPMRVRRTERSFVAVQEHRPRRRRRRTWSRGFFKNKHKTESRDKGESQVPLSFDPTPRPTEEKYRDEASRPGPFRSTGDDLSLDDRVRIGRRIDLDLFNA